MADRSSDYSAAPPDADDQSGPGDSLRSHSTRARGTREDDHEARSDRWRALRRFLVVVALGFVPWTLVAGSDLTYVFPFGLLNDDPWTLVWVHDYLRFSRYGRSAAIESWLLGVGVYVGALASALGGVAGREDRRLTAGLLVVAGVSQFPLVEAFSRRPGTLALPVGSLLLVVAAWWLYGPAVAEWVAERSE